MGGTSIKRDFGWVFGCPIGGRGRSKGQPGLSQKENSLLKYLEEGKHGGTLRTERANVLEGVEIQASVVAERSGLET